MSHERRRNALTRAAVGAALLGALAFPDARAGAQHGTPHAHGGAAETGKVRVQLSVFPDSAMEGKEVELQVRVTDAHTGRPVTGLAPMAWMDVRPEKGATPLDVCRQKTGAFAEGSLHVKHGQMNITQPVEDLNGHYLLVMSRSPQLVVIDPVKGFGRTRLFTTVPLPSPGEDWAATVDDRRLFVSLPAAGKVGVVSTHSWKVERLVDAGRAPTRVLLPPGGRHLWVSNSPAGEAGGVTALDAVGARVAARIPTGVGPHALALSDDGRLLFVANRGSGTLSIIDTRRLAKVGEVKTGAGPVALAYSPARKAVFVAHEEDGTVAAVDVATRQVVERIPLRPGIISIRFAPEPAGGHGAGHGGAHGAAAGGRLAFIPNPREGTVDVHDVVARKHLRTAALGVEPDQVSFTSSFAFIRSAGTANVTLLPLNDPTTGGTGPHDAFPAGSTPPGAASGRGLGEMVIPTPGTHDAVYAVNPAERMIYAYHYMEGMPVPHGGLTTYGFEPRAVRTVSRRMRETTPGVYAVTVRPERSGDYDLIFRAPDPHALECLGFSVRRNPALQTGARVRIAPYPAAPTLRPGENVLRFRVVGAPSDAPLPAVPDLRVQVASPLGWQVRADARPVGDGTYEATVSLPGGGVYYLAFEAPSLGVGLRDLSPVILRADDR